MSIMKNNSIVVTASILNETGLIINKDVEK